MATTRTMSIEELAQLPEDEGRFELLDRELIAAPLASALHAATLTNVAVHIGGHVRRNNLGVALSGGAGFVVAREPVSLLRPDFAFVGAPLRTLPDPNAHLLEGAPDLAVEIIDREDRYMVVEGKVERYLAAGAASVWLLDLHASQAIVCAADRTRRYYGGDELISGEPAVVGLRIRAADLFQ